MFQSKISFAVLVVLSVAGASSASLAGSMSRESVTTCEEHLVWMAASSGLREQDRLDAKKLLSLYQQAHAGHGPDLKELTVEYEQDDRVESNSESEIIERLRDLNGSGPKGSGCPYARAWSVDHVLFVLKAENLKFEHAQNHSQLETDLQLARVQVELERLEPELAQFEGVVGYAAGMDDSSALPVAVIQLYHRDAAAKARAEARFGSAINGLWIQYGVLGRLKRG